MNLGSRHPDIEVDPLRSIVWPWQQINSSEPQFSNLKNEDIEPDDSKVFINI